MKIMFRIIILSSLFFEFNSFILNNNIISNYNHKRYVSNYDSFYNICLMNNEYNMTELNNQDNLNIQENFLDEYHKNNTPYYNFNEKNNNINFDEIHEFIKENKEIEKREKKEKKEKYSFIEPTSKDLKLLNNMITVEWAKNWIYNMVHYTDTFPTFMYQDMFLIRDFAIVNTSKQYLYIGYFPSDIRCIHGPYYIGAFELVPKSREFHTHLLVQNPNYMIENEYDENKIIDFKKELIKMTQDALVFFKFNKLKKGNNDRYYYSWLYGDH